MSKVKFNLASDTVSNIKPTNFNYLFCAVMNLPLFFQFHKSSLYSRYSYNSSEGTGVNKNLKFLLKLLPYNDIIHNSAFPILYSRNIWWIELWRIPACVCFLYFYHHTSLKCGCMVKFGKPPMICQIHQDFPPPNIYAMRYIQMPWSKYLS